MPSRLNNLFKTLTWDDFQGTPPADEQEENAATASEIVIGGLSVAHKPGGGVTIADTLTITIAMHQRRSWVRPGTETDALLNHEQQHYNITALTGRDLFLDLMALKARTFPNAGALQTELTAIRAGYAPQPIHNRYDSVSETNGGRNASQQMAWDGLIARAFTTPRTPAESATDGTAYKLRLRDVLRTAGKL